MQHNESSCDVLIVGAGLVGNSLALSLADSANVTMVEANPLAAPLKPDERALALSFSTQRILAALNIWPTIQSLTTPIQQVHVSEAGHFGAIRFSAQEHHVAALGYVISAQVLTDALRRAVLEKPAVSCFYGTTVQQIIPIPDGYRVHTQTPNGPRTFTTRLLVGADGVHSPTRKFLGIAAKQENYAQTALTARMSIDGSHQNIAYERFTEQAVLATLPTGSNEVGIVWTTATKRAHDLSTLSDQEFCAQFQTAFGYRLGNFTEVKKRSAYPIGSLHALEQIRPHAVLLGNSAHTLHPVAAQGFNLSLRDVATLAQTTMDALTTGENPGRLTVLEKYLALRRKEQLETMGFTQSIIHSFSQKTLPWTLIKEGGLLGLALLPFVKNRLAQHAMGLADQIPKWVLKSASAQ